MATSTYLVKGEQVFRNTSSGIENVGYAEKISFNKNGSFAVMTSKNGTKSFFNTKNLTWES